MSLSGSQKTRIGVLGSPGIAYAGFTAKAEGAFWNNATTNSSVWAATQQSIQTTWDGGLTTWDLDGNVNQTMWDVTRETWSNNSTNSPTWSDA